MKVSSSLAARTKKVMCDYRTACDGETSEELPE
jgi:hypothetical protein